MEKRNLAFTEFGRAVHIFCADHCMKKSELALAAGVNYDTLLKVCKGIAAGHAVVPAVEAAMDRIAQGRATV